MLTDLFLDKSAKSVPLSQLCSALSEVCVPLAGRCILKLRTGHTRLQSTDELMIEFELCIGLIFKPLRHHLQSVLEIGPQDGLPSVWKSVLTVIEGLLRGDEEGPDKSPDREQHAEIPDGLKSTMVNLANEHLRNAIIVLITAGVILSDDESSKSQPGDITSITVDAVTRMGISKSALEEWKEAARASVTQ